MSRRGSEDSSAHEWICGIHSVLETLRAKPNCARELLAARGLAGKECSEILERARKAGVRVVFVERRDMDRRSGDSRHQGVALKITAHQEEDLYGFLGRFDPQARAGLLLVALDQIQDPHNLGAIARSAVNLGAQALLVPERRSAPVTRAAIEASAGAIQKIPVISVGNLAQALTRCKEEGFWIYGADGAGKAAWDATLNAPMILVIGSEGYGIRPLVKSLCDELIAVPQSAHGVESLNASCAASILIYEAKRQGRKKP